MKLHPFQKKVLTTHIIFTIISIIISLVICLGGIKRAIIFFILMQMFMLMYSIPDFFDEGSIGNVKGINPFKSWEDKRNPIIIIPELYITFGMLIIYFIIIFYVISNPNILSWLLI